MMDKLEVLVRLDLLDSELSYEENVLKEWCNKCELYPHCKRKVTLYWNVKDRGYKAFCPVCGEKVDTRLRWVYMLTSKNNRNNKNN